MAVMAVMMEAASGSRVMSLTKDMSILRLSTGSFLT